MIQNPQTPDQNASSPPTSDASALEHATALALATLCDIIRDAESSDRDRRLAAVAILRHAAAMKPRTATRSNVPPKPRERSTGGRTGPVDDFDDWWPDGPRPTPLGPDHPDHPYAKDVAEAYDRGYADAKDNRPRHTPGLVGRLDRVMDEFSKASDIDNAASQAPEADESFLDHDDVQALRASGGSRMRAPGRRRVLRSREGLVRSRRARHEHTRLTPPPSTPSPTPSTPSGDSRQGPSLCRR